MNYNQRKNLAYVIGITLGDGNLSNPNGRAVRLRITCDTRYPKLIERIRDAIQVILPNNKVSIVKRRKTYVDVSCYSNKWEKFLGWEARGGSKYDQSVRIPVWIKRNNIFLKECIRGLLETDGSLYNDRGYRMIGFVTVIPVLAKDVYNSIMKFGFSVHIYIIQQTKKRTRYNIRISKNVEEFIQTFKLKKD